MIFASANKMATTVPPTKNDVARAMSCTLNSSSTTSHCEMIPKWISRKKQTPEIIPETVPILKQRLFPLLSPFSSCTTPLPPESRALNRAQFFTHMLNSMSDALDKKTLAKSEYEARIQIFKRALYVSVFDILALSQFRLYPFEAYKLLEA
jgi:hypothetical protein